MAEERDAPHLPAIVNKTYVRTSVSQIRTFKDCEVKWGFDKIEQIERGPEGKGAAFGKLNHGHLETLIKVGDDQRTPLARAGDFMHDEFRHTFPAKGGKGLVESGLENPTLTTPGGVEVVGYVDYAAALADRVLVVDHKFTKDLIKYAVPAVDEANDALRVAGKPFDAMLYDDEQAIVYLYWAFRRFAMDRGEFRLNRYQSQGRKYFEQPRIRLDKHEVDDRIVEIVDVVDRRMFTAAKADKAAELKPNAQSCGKYGGCQYARICPHSPSNKFLSFFIPDAAVSATPVAPEVSNMGLLDRITGGTPTTPAAVIAAPVQQTAPVAQASNGKIKVTECVAEKAYEIPGKGVAAFKAIMGANAFFLTGDGRPLTCLLTDEVIDRSNDPVSARVILGETVTAAQAAAPVQAAPAVTTSIMPPDAPASNPAPAGGLMAALSAAAAPAAPAPVEIVIPVALTVTPETKRARGRPKKAKVEGEAQTSSAAPTGDAFSDEGELILLIDCALSGAPAVDLNRVVAEAARMLAEKTDCMDIRIAPKKGKDGADHVLAYGGWRPLLADIVVKGGVAGLCTINSSELNDPVIERLAAEASLVVRGGVR